MMSFQRKPWDLAIFAAIQGNSCKHSLGNLSSKDGRVRFLLRDLSMCLTAMIETNELSHPRCSLHVQRQTLLLMLESLKTPLDLLRDVLGRKKSIRSLKGKFSELPVSRKKCLNYIHFLTSKDSRGKYLKDSTAITRTFVRSLTWAGGFWLKKKTKPTNTKTPNNQKKPPQTNTWTVLHT